VYVRQSSPHQVQHHLESQRLQYALVERAGEWGCSDVQIIDDDLGVTAAQAGTRAGFHKLVTEVSLRRVGIILTREVPRLARNNVDWYQLLDLCGILDTLIADQDAVYHPSHPNDRMILGLKGMMSEVELTVLKNRMLEGARNKAKRGELVYRLPIGLVTAEDGKIIKDPDTRIQAVVDQVFAKFRETQSIRQTLLWFVQENMAFPRPEYTRGQPPRIVWKPPNYTLFNSILRNPYYAGAYVFGRRTTRTEVRDLQVRKTKGHELPMSEWRVLIKNHHIGYITWEEYEKNLSVIADNLRKYGQSRGPVLGGAGLLAGLLRCKRCGRKLSVAYSGRGGNVPFYICSGSRGQDGGAYCLHFGGLRVDQVVSREVLRVVEPAAMDAAFRALEDLNHESQERIRLLALELQQAEYEADRAFRQYNRAEPENRLVTASLENKWNAKLQHVEAVKRRIAAAQTEIRPLSAAQKQSLLRLADDLPSIWRAGSTTVEMRKRIIRTVLEEAVVDVDPSHAKIILDLHWKGGVHTHLEVRKNRTGEHRHCTDQQIVELVRQLASQLQDTAIVPILNKLGYKTGHGNTWTTNRLRSLRNSHGIASFDPNAPRTWVTLQQAAQRLGICDESLRNLIRDGVVAARQIVKGAPWCIEPEELHKESVQQAAAAIAQKRPGRWRNSSRQNQKGLFQ
jgi:DNA invertase Pin-like site-specific DNA recombinase